MVLNKYQCRRKKQIEVNDDRNIVKSVIVFNASKNYSLFEDCKTCGYGHNGLVLKTIMPQTEMYNIKTCTFRRVV